MKILFLWDGPHPRDLGEEDMMILAAEHYTVLPVTPLSVMIHIEKGDYDVLWLGVHHQSFDIKWDELFSKNTKPVVIDQADNEEFVTRAIKRYRKIKNGVICARYLPNKLLDAYREYMGMPVMQLSWYINPNRFVPKRKAIDVCFIGSMYGRRYEWAEKVRAIADKHNLSAVVGEAWGKTYTDILTQSKVSIVECERQCLTQKYIESIHAGCALVGDKPIYPSNPIRVLDASDLEESILWGVKEYALEGQSYHSPYLDDLHKVLSLL